MIQDPIIIPKSLEIAGWLGGGGFTMWIVKQTLALFKEYRKNENGKINAEAEKKAVDLALHMKEQSELHKCVEEIAKFQLSEARLLDRLTISYERQTTLLENMNHANKRR